MIKHTLHICLLLFIALLLVACAEPAVPTATPTVPAPESKFLGNWELSTGESFAFEFFKGGTLKLTYDGREYPGTYELPQEDQIRMVIGGDLGAREFLLTDVNASDTTLSCVLNGDRIEMVRLDVGLDPMVSLEKVEGDVPEYGEVRLPIVL